MTLTGQDLVCDQHFSLEIASHFPQKCTNVRLLKPSPSWRHLQSLSLVLLDTLRLLVASARSLPSGLPTSPKSSGEDSTRTGTDQRRRPSLATPRSTLRTAASRLLVSLSASANTALLSAFLPTLKSARLAWAKRRLISWRSS